MHAHVGGLSSRCTPNTRNRCEIRAPSPYNRLGPASIAPSQLMALNVGDRLGHYDVTALIGEGGMGQVYRARDTKLGHEVALKLFNKEIDDV